MKSIKKFRFSDVILFAALLLIGGFHEYISCGLAVAMSLYLLVRLARKRNLTIRKDLLTSAVVALCLGYGLTCFWGIDRGMAFVGFVKYLPLILYLLCLQQDGDGDCTEQVLPYFGGAMAVITAIAMQFPWGKELFSVAGRLAGFFQYPNTFAVFLLVCQLLLLKKPEKKIWDYAMLAVLVAGFLYTGSRTAFVVAILANVAMLLSMTRKKVRMISLAAMGGICLVGLILAINPDSVLHRYLTISLTESTFVGRLLYWMDALPLLLKYPFGMGYMGYFYVQQSIQSGVYSVAYIHNDLLQLLLDVGLLPTGLFVGALVRWFFKKTVPLGDKIIAGAVCLHSLFDFNLQFIGVFFLLLWLLSRDKEDKLLVVKPKLPLKLVFGVAALVGLYMGTALLTAHLGARELSDAIYPYNTQNKLEMLEQETDLQTAADMAEEILEQNTHFFAPYTILAKQCYSRGDFSGVIQNCREALERSPFRHTEYEDYCKMLITGIELYKKAGNLESAQICEKELLSVAEQLAENRNRLSTLGKMIDDQPVMVLSKELRDYIAKIGG